MLISIILAVLLVAVAFAIPFFLMRKAVRQVIKIFRAKDALTIDTAKTVQELGIIPQTALDRLFKKPDYKPQAVQLLFNNNIVCLTEDNRLYLAESKLATIDRQKSGLVLKYVLPPQKNENLLDEH
ncbi:MAG: hypothetical protein ACOX3A_02120 [bacterium]|jgi:hypothetical protein